MSRDDWQRRCDGLVELVEASAWAQKDQDVYQRLAESLARLFSCQQVHIHLISNEGDAFSRCACYSQQDVCQYGMNEDSAVIGIKVGRVRRLVQAKQPIVSDYENPHKDDQIPKAAFEHGYRWSVSFPLFIEGAVYGLCSLVYSTPLDWDEGKDAYAMQVGRVLGSIVARIRATKESADLRVLEDRRSISFKLSEDVAQMIGSLSLAADSALTFCENEDFDGLQKSLGRIGLISRESMKLLREDVLSWNSPLYLTDGIVGEVEACLERAKRVWDFECELVDEIEHKPLVLSMQVASHLLRILRECLGCLLSLSFDSKADVGLVVTLREDGKFLTLMIEEAEGAVAGKISCDRMDIRVMSERAEAVGGRLSVMSSGLTTMICVDLPISTIS